MKFFRQFLILSVLCFAAINGNQDDEETIKCLKTLQISREDFSKTVQDRFQNASDKIKCFFDCYGKEKGFLKNGEIIHDEFVKYATASDSNAKIEEIDNAILTCSKKFTGANECEKAFNYMACIIKF